MSEWVSVKDRLPEFQRVLVRVDTGFTCVAGMCGETFTDINGELKFKGDWYWGVINDIEIAQNNVTHWMPLPPPPPKDAI